MAGLQQYALASIYVGGRLLAEAVSVSITRKTMATPGNTLNKGFAGQSPGPKMIEIQVESLVPDAGFEYDPGVAMEGNVPVKFLCFAAGQTLATNGFVNEDTFKQSVSAAASQGFTAACEWALWK